MTSSKKSKAVVDKVVETDVIEDLYGPLGHVDDPAPTSVRTVESTRNFDQLDRGQRVVVDVNETYWSQNLASGNLVEVSE